MDAGELGTFLGGNVLFIDIDDDQVLNNLHNNNTSSDPRSFKWLTRSSAGSDDDSASAHQDSAGSLSHLSFATLENERASARTDSASNRVKKRCRSDDLDTLALEVESSANLVKEAMDMATPHIQDSLVNYFPSAPSRQPSTEDVARLLNSKSSTQLLPPPPNAEGVALGLPCTADMCLLDSLCTSKTTSQSLHYCQSVFAAPRLAPASTDLSKMLQDVLDGRVRSPPLGLKLDIGSVVKEMQQRQKTTTAAAAVAANLRPKRKQ